MHVSSHQKSFQEFSAQPAIYKGKYAGKVGSIQIINQIASLIGLFICHLVNKDILPKECSIIKTRILQAPFRLDYSNRNGNENSMTFLVGLFNLDLCLHYSYISISP